MQNLNQNLNPSNQLTPFDTSPVTPHGFLSPATGTEQLNSSSPLFAVEEINRQVNNQINQVSADNHQFEKYQIPADLVKCEEHWRNTKLGAANTLRTVQEAPEANIEPGGLADAKDDGFGRFQPGKLLY